MCDSWSGENVSKVNNDMEVKIEIVLSSMEVKSIQGGLANKL